MLFGVVVVMWFALLRPREVSSMLLPGLAAGARGGDWSLGWVVAAAYSLVGVICATCGHLGHVCNHQ